MYHRSWLITSPVVARMDCSLSYSGEQACVECAKKLYSSFIFTAHESRLYMERKKE